MSTATLKEIYPRCAALCPHLPSDIDPAQVAGFLENNPDLCRQHPYLVDLARIEWSRYRLLSKSSSPPAQAPDRCINPTLELVAVQWRYLPELIRHDDTVPEQGACHILIFRRPESDDVVIKEATGHDLLALKLVSEQTDSRSAAREADTPLATIDNILYLAEHEGVLIPARSKIVREKEFPRGTLTDPAIFTAPTFTLQWHITQRCDLHCRHCYDRSERATVSLAEGVRILDDLYAFCQEMHVFTQVTFTGGNPLLHPEFNRLYQEAAERGFMTAILGNPMPQERILEILEIHPLEFYQVSLEGLREHNDYIRGPGHFDRVLAFLEILRELGIYSMVMLTLTRNNMDQVLPLAELLRDRVNLFTFNRLAMVGEGVNLASADPARYPVFLEDFMRASQTNPILGLKDNLFNLLRYRQSLPLVGGCAGYGCGAAFNFVSLLPDGEVHACRKLPSLIGNIREQSFSEIYHSDIARKYRLGPSGCKGCEIRPLCGGCLAVAYGFGLDIFTETDPYCFR